MFLLDGEKGQGSAGVDEEPKVDPVYVVRGGCTELLSVIATRIGPLKRLGSLPPHARQGVL